MKIDFNKLLDELDHWIAESDKWQDAFDELNKVIAPSCHAPIIEDRYVGAFMDGLTIMHPELKEELEYYIYETPFLKEAKITYKGVNYNAKKRDEFVKYIETINSEK